MLDLSFGCPLTRSQTVLCVRFEFWLSAHKKSDRILLDFSFGCPLTRNQTVLCSTFWVLAVRSQEVRPYSAVDFEFWLSAHKKSNCTFHTVGFWDLVVSSQKSNCALYCRCWGPVLTAREVVEVGAVVGVSHGHSWPGASGSHPRDLHRGARQHDLLPVHVVHVILPRRATIKVRSQLALTLASTSKVTVLTLSVCVFLLTIPFNLIWRRHRKQIKNSNIDVQ